MGAFAEWQPQYAARGISTFPVVIDGKRKAPAVKGYLKIGLNTSSQLAMKFAEHEAIGLACRKNRITVLDVDTPDERVLAEALSRHGPTPFIVRSGSGNWQCWYSHSGESRRVRPDPGVPIDILGDGYVVAPPSLGAKGRYEIVQGSLDDLDRLPKMRGVLNGNVASEPSCERTDPNPEIIEPTPRAQIDPLDIKRNETLWRHCMKVARSCARLENLMEAAVEYNNAEFYRPLPADEVLKIVASAWGYEVEGKNRFGYGPRVVLDVEAIDDLLRTDLRAFGLFAWLMRHNAGIEDFILAKGAAESLGWSVNTMRAAREALVERNLIECIHPGGKGPNDPPRYRFKKGVRN